MINRDPGVPGRCMRAVLCLPFFVLSSSSLDAAAIQVSYLQSTAECEACFVRLLLPNQTPMSREPTYHGSLLSAPTPHATS